MLEDKDLKFASRSYEGGVGASAGFGTVGGGAAVVANRKRDVSEAALSQIDLLMCCLLENSDRLTSKTEKRWCVCSRLLPHLRMLALLVPSQLMLPPKNAK